VLECYLASVKPERTRYEVEVGCVFQWAGPKKKALAFSPKVAAFIIYSAWSLSFNVDEAVDREIV
jgi:hypothetical protein